MRHTFYSSFTLAGLIFLAASAPAAILEYKAEFGGAPIHSFEQFIDTKVGGISYTSRTKLQLTGPTPTLTGTLDPGDQFRIVFSAPSGSLFSILPRPIGSSEFGFFARFSTTQIINNLTNFVDTTASLVGASVPPPIPSRLEFVSGMSGQKSASVEFSASGFSFKSIVITTTIPAGFSDGFINVSPFLLQFEAYSVSDLNVNPGPLVSLIPEPSANVPEPASLLLVPTAMGLFALVGRKRRQS